MFSRRRPANQASAESCGMRLTQGPRARRIFKQDRCIRATGSLLPGRKNGRYMTLERSTPRPWLEPGPPAEGGASDRGHAGPAANASDKSSLSPQDRRTSPRRPHRVYQWIAPCIGGRLPDQSMFYQVQCIDISRTGIGFFSDEPLSSEEVIIAIGTTADAVYVRARVMNSVRVEDMDGVRYRVGCEFIERIGPQRPNAEGTAGG
jgi:hypothetical protein